MRSTIVSLLSLFVSCFILMLGNGLINILLPVRMQLESMNTDTIGMVLSLYYVGMLAGGVLSKNLIKRAGHIRMFAGCISLAAISILVCSLYTDAVLWGAMRVVIGFCNACAFTAMESWLNGASTRDTRGQILAFYQAVVLGAMFAGQFMINLASPAESLLFVLSGILLCLAVIPIVLSKHKGPEVSETTPMSIIALFKRSPLGVVACFTSGVIYSAVFSLLPVFAGRYGIEGFQLSLYVGAAILGAFLLQFPVGYLSDRFDRRLVLLIALLISALVGFSVERLAAFDMFIAMSIATAISSGIISCTYPLSISETFDKLRQNEMVAAMGSLILAFSAGGALGPYITSLAMKLMGNSALFYLVGVVQLVLGAFVLLRMSIRTALPAEDQESFVMQSGMVPTVADLDPRIEYVEAALPLSSAARAAVEIAETDPAAAVKMARAMVIAKPEQGVEIAAAVAKVEGVDPLRLYQVMLDAVPFQIMDVTSAIVKAAPDLGYELVQKLAENQPSEVVEVAAEIGRTLPELRLDMAKVAVESAPESAIEVAEYYAQVLAEEREAMRPADKEDDSSEQDALDMMSQFNEMAPEHALDVATKFVEAVPDTAVAVATEYATNLVSDTEDEPDTDTDTDADADADADADVEESSQLKDAAEIVSRLSDVVPEQTLYIGAAVVGAVPESISEVVEAINDSESEQSAGEVVSRLVDAAPEQALDIGAAVVGSLPDSATEVIDALNDTEGVLESVEDAGEVVTRLAEASPEQALDIGAAVISAVEDSASEVIDALNDTEGVLETSQDAGEMVTRLVEASPEQALDIGAAVVGVVEDSASNVVDALNETEGVLETSQDAGEVVTRLAEAAPEQALDIGAAVVGAVEDSASDVVEALNESEGALEGVEDAGEVVNRLVDASPEQAVEIGVAVVEAIPESASEVVEALEEMDSVSNENLVSHIDEKPEEVDVKDTER